MQREDGPPIAAALEALRRARRPPSAELARDELDERITSGLRVVLAVASLAIHLVDPTEDPSRRVVTAAVLAGFGAYAAVLHLLVLRRARRVPRAATPWVDVAWVTLLVAASTGTSSIFFPMYLFAILCAGFGRGFRAGAAVTAASVLSFGVVGGLSTPLGPAFELDRSLIRPLYVLVLGYLISHWGAHENRLRARLSLLRDISTISNPRFGAEQTIGRMLARLCAYYGADACQLVVADDARGEVWIRTAARGQADAGPRVPLPAPLAAALMPRAATAAVVCGWRRAFLLGRRRLRCDVVELGGGATPAGGGDLAAAGATLGARSFVSVPFRYDALALGRVYVASSDDRAFDGLDVDVLAGVLDRVLPAVENVRLVDRLATDAAEEERQRLARGLHDAVIQPYLGLHLGIRATRDALARGHAAVAAGFAARLADVAEAEIGTLRAYVRSLRGGSHGSAQRPILAASLERFCARFQAATGIAVDAAVDARTVSDRVAAEVLELVAEALANVRRHTESPRASVRVSADGELLRITVENDAASAPPPFSPWSIRERAAALGGSIDIERGAGRTAVRVDIPL